MIKIFLNLIMQKSVIIVAAGSGKRMGGQIPKQFLELNGRPVLMWTLEKFHATVSGIQIILVLPVGEVSYWDKLCIKHDFTVKHEVVFGGETRYQSVQNGIKHALQGSLVAIHDGVRPLVSTATILSCYKKAEQSGNAIPVISPPESIRQLENGQSKALKREGIFLIQTPQVFTWEQVENSYSQESREEFTDDASVVEAMGYELKFVEGNPENIKITRPYDLKLASFLIGLGEPYSEGSSL